MVLSPYQVVGGEPLARDKASIVLVRLPTDIGSNMHFRVSFFVMLCFK